MLEKRFLRNCSGSVRREGRRLAFGGEDDRALWRHRGSSSAQAKTLYFTLKELGTTENATSERVAYSDLCFKNILGRREELYIVSTGENRCGVGAKAGAPPGK